MIESPHIEILIEDDEVRGGENSPRDESNTLLTGVKMQKSQSTISLTISVQSQSPYDDKHDYDGFGDENKIESESQKGTRSPGSVFSFDSSRITLSRSNSDPLRGGSDVVLLARCTSEPLPGKGSSALSSAQAIRNSYRTRNNRRNVLVTLIRRVRPESLRNSLNKVVKTFYCKICMENCPQSMSFAAHSCSKQHEYCIPCMSGYLAAQVEEGVIYFNCPGFAECQSSLATEELRLLLTEESISRLDRIKTIKTNPMYRECPQCSAGFTPASSDIEGNNSDIICQGCNTTYCFYHSNAHAGKTCQEYLRDMSKRVKDELCASEQYVVKVTKGCPNCHSATEKNGGCNHMTCGVCKTDWCWLCSRIITNPADHYSPGNFLGCPASQFTDVAPLQYDTIFTGYGNGLCARIVRAIVWVAFVIGCRLCPTIFAVIVGGICYIIGTILLSPLLFVVQTYHGKYDLSTYPYVGFILSVFVLSICCIIVDILWIPCLVVSFSCSHGLRTGALPSCDALNDHLLLYSLVITFLMLIDIEG